MRKLVSLLLPLIMGAFSASAAPRPLPAAPACAPWECAVLKAPPTIHVSLARATTSCPDWGGSFYTPNGGNYTFVPACAPGGNNATNGASWAVFSFYPGFYDGYTYDPQPVNTSYYSVQELSYTKGAWRIDVTDPAGMNGTLTLMVTQTDPSGNVSDPQEYTVTFD